ncbi:MAG: hypothetical protein DHS20C18_08880 [Saprospiraceae bacterium]|nr:MAG: hypothetical protein DHS20C18_08880 [Saprospiraceae bacterium]
MKSPFSSGTYAHTSTQISETPLSNSLRKYFIKNLLLLLLITGSSFLSAQSLIVTPPKGGVEHGDSSHLITSLPALPAPLGISKKVPDYRYLYIYGDGNFTNYSKLDSLYHVYPAFSLAKNNSYNPRVYATAIYTGGNPPPRLHAIDIKGVNEGVKDPAINHEAIVPIIDTIGRDIKLQLNQEVRAGDTMVAILSFRNPTTDTITGQVYFFHNSNIRKGKKSELAGTTFTSSTNFSKFDNIFPIVHFNKIAKLGRVYSNLAGGLGDKYKKVLVQDFNNLAPGEEMHLFIEMTCDPAMDGFFTGKEIAQLDFMGMMTAFTELDTFLTDSQQSFAADNKVIELIEGLIQSNETPVTVGTADDPSTGGNFNDFARLIVDIETIQTSLTKEHDPNELNVEACTCTVTNQQKLIFTVDCENDGYGNSNDLFIYMDIPEEIDINSISSTPLKFFPPVPAGSVKLDVDVAARQIKWSVPGLILDGTAELGYAAPSTQAQIIFTGFTQAGVKLEDIPPMNACIRFIDDPTKQTCTPMDTVSPIQNGSETGLLMDCQSCDSSVSPSGNFPWWAWLMLILFLLLLLIIWAIRRNSNT